MKCNTVLAFTEEAATFSAEQYAKLRKHGSPLEDIDLLIAGIALSNNLVLVTHNSRHFVRIEGLELADWSLDTQERKDETEE